MPPRLPLHAGRVRTATGARRAGFTLIEVMVAAFLVLIVFFGLAQFYARGRTQVDYEEDRRKATAVAQARLDGLRRDFRYEELAALDGTDTTYVVDGRNFVVSHVILADNPEEHATTCSLLVTWSARVGATTVDRTLEATTMLGRGLP